MGKDASLIHTDTKVPEQLLNKTCMASSTVVNFFANIEEFPKKYTNYVLKKYFPFLMEDQEKFTVSEKRYDLSPIELTLLSTVDNIEITKKTLVHKLDKIRLNKLIISTNAYSTLHNEKNNNQYIITESGKYLVVYKIVKVQKNVYLYCSEFTHLKPYTVNLSPGMEFGHTQFTKNLSLTMQIIKKSEINRPFSLIKLNGMYFLHDLFSRHM